ncbi:MAG: RNA polymerase subunit sigma [Planctomycetota bacterium]|nr:MAG: RNA polymerase subunit sigma [Planctomycetota bacterium]
MSALLEEDINTLDLARTTAELVEAAQMGDREAFGELFERYENTVYNVGLRRLGDHGEAQELCQEVFVQALLKIGQLRTPDAFAGWIVSITHRMAINRAVRRRPVAPAENETIETVYVENRTPLVNVLDRERARQVRAGLDRLGQLDRDTLVAFYVDGQSLVEMSTAFRSPIGTIKRRLHVARKRLKQQLEDVEAAAV